MAAESVRAEIYTIRSVTQTSLFRIVLQFNHAVKWIKLYLNNCSQVSYFDKNGKFQRNFDIM